MDKTWKVILAFSGIFAAGGVTGGLIALRVAAPPPGPAAMVEMPTPIPTATAPSATQTPPANEPPTRPTTAETKRPALQSPEQIGPQLFRRLTNQLGLSPEQRQKVRPIELRATEELNRLRRDSVHATQVLIDKNEDEIRAQLTPEQAAKFDIMVAAQRDRIAKFVIEQQKHQREQREKMMQSPNKGAGVVATPASAPAGGDGSKK